MKYTKPQGETLAVIAMSQPEDDLVYVTHCAEDGVVEVQYHMSGLVAAVDRAGNIVEFDDHHALIHPYMALRRGEIPNAIEELSVWVRHSPDLN